MKLTKLTKDELCGLLKRLLSLPYNLNYFVNDFLRERWGNKCEELIEELGKVDILKDFSKYQRINKRLDEMCNNVKYYCQLDEPDGGK